MIISSVFYVGKSVYSIKRKREYFQNQISNILSLLHKYDSINDVNGIERNKFLFMAFHLFLTNIIGSPKSQNMDIYGNLYITENGKQKLTTFYHATQILQPEIQHRIEMLPDDIKKDFLAKVNIENNNVVLTETNLLNAMRNWFSDIDFKSLKMSNFGNDIL